MVKACAQQGDILWLEKEEQYVLVLSREFFNQSGMSVVCPLREKAEPDALHMKISGISYEQIQDISDAVQGIFEYYPFSI